MRTLVNGFCGCTVAASAWLGVMSVVLHRPGYERTLGLAACFVLQSLLTLAITAGRLTAGRWRLAAIAGATGIVWAGGAAVANTLSGPHFEGYTLVIGVGLVLQGLLTAGHLVTPGPGRSSKVHQFGN